jgi:hypothetical protein
MKLKDHIAEAHDGADLDNFTDEEVQTPKTNSQGKVCVFILSVHDNIPKVQCLILKYFC